jgi:hypothetical protein
MGSASILDMVDRKSADRDILICKKRNNKKIQGRISDTLQDTRKTYYKNLASVTP